MDDTEGRTGAPGRPDDRPGSPSRDPEAESTGVRIIGAEEAAAALQAGQASGRRPDDEPRFGDRPPPPTVPPGAAPRVRFPLPDSTEVLDDVAAAPTPPHGLPHWTEPPTGEVPRILADQPPADEDDLEAWQSFTSRAPRWRDQQADWSEPDFDDVSALADDVRAGALDETRADRPDPYSFDDEPPAPQVPVAPAPTAIRTGPRREPAVAPPVAAGGERNLPVAVATGVGFAVLALILFRAGPAPTMVLALAIVTLCAVEVFDVLRRVGYRPATLLGLTATVSVMLAAYSKGETAIPLVLALTVVSTMLWFLFGVVRARPTMNIAATLVGFVWVGMLGSFAALMLRLPERRGIALLAGAILATVAYDVGGLFVGRRSGRTPLAPEISPNKTVEGLIGGMVAAVFMSVLVTRMVHPWSLGSALALGVVVAVLAPLGDLCQSMVKRDLGLKDMGSVLPGHGGLMDRFDALLFVLPGTYYLARLLDFA